MTSTVMLATVRVILDETTESFWTDSSIYAALADGQNQVIERLLAIYRTTGVLKRELESIIYDGTGTSNPITIPAGFLELFSVTYDHDGTGGGEKCEILTHRQVLDREDNSFHSATSTEPTAYVKSASGVQGIYFYPAVSGAPAISIQYFKTPTDIAAGQNAILPGTTHSAIVHYAVSRMLDKDQRPQDAQLHYGLFVKEIEGL